MKKPLVSINIRTYNSAKTLEKTLESVKKQTYKNIETIISDGFSKDDTIKIAKTYSTRIYYSDKLGDARQQAVEKSKGKYVLSLDSDQVMDKTLIAKCVNECEKKKLDALIISERSFIIKGTPTERLIAYDKWIVDKSKDDDPVFGTASPRFFSNKMLKKIKWPKKIAIFDDTILYSEILNIGAKVGYLANPAIRHHEVTSWITLFKKFYRYGKGFPLAVQQKPGTIVAHTLPRKSYFSRLAFTKPHYFVGIILLYVIKVIAATLGMMSYYLSNILK